MDAPGGTGVDSPESYWALNFFLGVTCPFCLSQIEAFRDFLPEFQKEGVEMISITTDDTKMLSRALGPSKSSKMRVLSPFPFEVLADPELVTFKEYGVFDQFENGPMHGTFLISSEGSILWSDISHQPFKYPQSLLEEARRLLAGETTSSSPSE